MLEIVALIMLLLFIVMILMSFAFYYATWKSLQQKSTWALTLGKITPGGTLMLQSSAKKLEICARSYQHYCICFLFSGCYYHCSPLRKGQIKFYEKIKKSEEYQELFQQFCHLPAVPPERVMNGIQTFVCDMYGKAKMSNVNDAWYGIFKQRYAPKSMLEPLEN